MGQLRAWVEQEIEGVDAEIAPEDTMCKEGARDHYFSVGQSALRGIKLAMLAAGKENAQTILDMGCGYGRVLRVLRAAFPQARITACDVVPGAVKYCAQKFGAIPILSRNEAGRIPIRAPFDVIWCGTLLTNINREAQLGFLKLFQGLLASGGVLVFTTQGRFVADRLRRGIDSYGLEAPVVQSLLVSYDQTGFGYGSYPRAMLDYAKIESDYGISVTSPSWVCATLERFPNLRLVIYAERGWDNHQDIVGCVRRDD
jgi:SAM-dependent methyltransferase